MTPVDVLEGRARWCVLTGRWQDVLVLPDRSVDHVITDPPYTQRTSKNARSATLEAFAMQTNPKTLVELCGLDEVSR